MIPLSKAVMRMSTYDRTNQELKWYEEPFYLCTIEGHVVNSIEEECRRRKINYKCFFVNERSKDIRKVRSLGAIHNNQKNPDEWVYLHVIKIKLCTWKTTTLERKQMADWAITTFNYGEPCIPDDLICYDVWIQPVREVDRVETECLEDFEEGRETHWV